MEPSEGSSATQEIGLLTHTLLQFICAALTFFILIKLGHTLLSTLYLLGCGVGMIRTLFEFTLCAYLWSNPEQSGKVYLDAHFLYSGVLLVKCTVYALRLLLSRPVEK